MTVRITVSGAKSLRQHIATLQGELRQEVSKAVTATAIDLQKDVKKRIRNGPATGIVYQKYNPKRTHKASRKGESPANDTGRLLNSIYFDREGDLTVLVGSNLVYAAYLEFALGRPYFRPAIEMITPKFKRRLNKVLRRATQ